MKLFVFKAGRTPLLALVLAGCMGLYALVRAPSAGAYALDRQLPIYCVEQTQKICAISFDAAWGDVLTRDLVDILNRYQVKATFFVIGKWAEQYPEDVKMLAANGMEVMSHSYAHDHMTQLSAEAVTADLNRCSDALEALTGVRPTLFRCPYGDYDDHVIRAARACGLEPIQWDVDSLDWKGIPAGEITQRVTSKVQPGSIILFHNAAKHTPEALPGILENLLSRGYTVVPVSRLILKGTYNRDFTIDHTGRQKAAAPKAGAAGETAVPSQSGAAPAASGEKAAASQAGGPAPTSSAFGGASSRQAA
jgi:polysaccharide deacetylase family sporulation protein PdaB